MGYLDHRVSLLHRENQVHQEYQESKVLQEVLEIEDR